VTKQPPRPGDVRIPRHFESFYRDQYPGVVALGYALSGSQATAEDVAQEAFIRAHGDWEKIGSYERPDAWVRRVATNLAFSRYRRLKAESRALLRIAGKRQQITFDIPEPEDDFWRNVRALPRRQAQVVALHYVEDRPITEIAQVLGIAEGSVKSALHKARAKLAEQLAEEDFV
jgi:RNA polymerase sigma-70 factor (ECF subfamily)